MFAPHTHPEIRSAKIEFLMQIGYNYIRMRDASYRVPLGSSLQDFEGLTRTWSAGLTATLGGANAGVEQG